MKIILNCLKVLACSLLSFISLSLHGANSKSSVFTKQNFTLLNKDVENSEVKVNVPLNGIYSVGGPTANYTTISSAVTSLNAFGVSGPVVFNINPLFGPYNTPLIINQIAGANANNTITFNGNGSVINYISTIYYDGILNLNGADWITIDSLNINAISTFSFSSILLTNGANNNSITNCKIKMNYNESQTGIDIGFNIFSLPYNSSNRNVIKNNVIIGGSNSISVDEATDTKILFGNIIEKNICLDFSGVGISLSNTDSTIVNSNDISRPGINLIYNFTGISVSDSTSNLIISNNKIHDSHTSNPLATSEAIGIDFWFSKSAAVKTNFIYNNLIYRLNNSGTTKGINLYQSNNIEVYNNTISLEFDGFTTDGEVIGFKNIGSAQKVKFKNNIISITKGGVGNKYIYSITSSTNLEIDYNLVYINSISSGFQAVGRSGLQDYITFKSMKALNQGLYDVHSYNENPQFVNNGLDNYIPRAFNLNGNAKPILNVNTDINSNLRDILKPDIGAHEFNLPNLDAGIINFIPISSPCSGNNSVKVIIKNLGQIPINLLTLNWNLNNISQTPFQFTGILNAGDIDTITLGNIIISPNTNYSIKSFTSLPNGVSDITNFNDTINFETRFLGFRGSYTIGRYGSDFRTITEAITAVKNNFVCGPIVFNLVKSNNPFNEQIEIPEINGLSQINTMTFNGNGSTLTYLLNNTSKRHIVKFDDCKYITFENFTIEIEEKSTFGIAFQLLNNASYNKIRNCKIKLPISKLPNGTNDNFRGIVITGMNFAILLNSTNASYNQFSENEIIGGLFGIHIIGSNNSTVVNNIKNKIYNNYIHDFISTGILIEGSDSTQIFGNNISRPNSIIRASFTGIRINNLNTNCSIFDNKIHDPSEKFKNLDGGVTGINFLNCLAIINKENKVYNNLIYNFKSNGSQFGVAITQSSGIWVSNNTIVLDDNTSSNATTTGIRHSSINNLRFNNNVINISRKGNGIKTGLDYASNATLFSSNNNCVFIDPTSGGTRYFGSTSNTNNYATLANFQAASGFDANSLESDPLISKLNNYVPLIGSPVVQVGISNLYVNKDIIGTLRSNTPTLGVFESARESIIPTIKYTKINDTYIVSNRILNNFATIYDSSGVDTSLIMRPRLYFKKTSDNNSFTGNTAFNNGWKYVLANKVGSEFNFIIDYSLLLGGNVSPNDVIQYFIVAQDLVSIPNVGFSQVQPISYAKTVELLAVNFPILGQINSFKILPIPLQNDLSITQFLNTDLKKCGLVNDTIGVIVTNKGLAAQSNFKIKLTLEGNGKDSITKNYLGNLLTEQSDTIIFNLLNTNYTGSISIVSSVSLVSDLNQTNDTIKSERSFYKNTAITKLINDTVCRGQTATLKATSTSNSVKWYSNEYDINSLFTGNQLVVPNIQFNDTLYVESNSVYNTNTNLKITELDVEDDKIEIQNLSNLPLNTTGWKVLVSDNFTDINAVNSIAWTLPATILPGAILFKTDQIGTNYWGNNILWGGGYPELGCWAIILDNNNIVQDAVFMNWQDSLIQNAAIFYNGKKLNVSNNWLGEGIDINIEANTTFVLQRVGIEDNDNSDDFIYNFVPTFGFNNSNLSSTFPSNACSPVRYPVYINLEKEVNLGPDLNLCNGDILILDAVISGNSYLWSTGATTQTISVNTAGTYSVTVTSLSGCTSSDAIVVSFAGALPIVNLGADINTCASVITVLDAGNIGSTYLWSTGATTQTISVNTAGTYSVLVTNAAGCSANDAIVVSQFAAANAAFTAAQAAGSRVVTFAPSVVIGTHEWDFGNGVGTSTLANPAYNYVINGVYNATHIITTADNCKDTSEVTVTVTTPVGISEPFISAFSYQIYPNPIQTETRISYELKERSTVQIKIYDVLGRIVLQPVNATQSIGKHEVLVNTDMLQNGSGVYEIQLIVNGQSETLRLVKVE